MTLDFCSTFYVYCYVSINQGKYLFCENLLGIKPDSDSDFKSLQYPDICIHRQGNVIMLESLYTI